MKIHWFRWKYFWGISDRNSERRENSSPALGLGYLFWMQKPNADSQLLALTHSGQPGGLLPVRLLPCSKIMWIIHGSGDYLCLSSLSTTDKNIFFLMAKYVKIRSKQGYIMEKKMNSRIQAPKCLRVTNLDQGAEIRAFTWCDSINCGFLTCMIFIYLTKNILMFSLIGIKIFTPDIFFLKEKKEL